MTIAYDIVDSPVGPLLLTAADGGLTGLAFRKDAAHRPATDWLTSAAAGDRARDALARAGEQLRAYFAGELTAFDLPLAPSGTPFQLKVWRALREIPYGETISYLELARRVGDPKAMRAVGGANGRNPIAVIVPCHRVIGADGSLTGFGGGMERKRWLLEHEGALQPEPALPL